MYIYTSVSQITFPSVHLDFHQSMYTLSISSHLIFISMRPCNTVVYFLPCFYSHRLELFQNVPNLQILACGRDVTAGWIMSKIDAILQQLTPCIHTSIFTSISPLTTCISPLTTCISPILPIYVYVSVKLFPVLFE